MSDIVKETAVSQTGGAPRSLQASAGAEGQWEIALLGLAFLAMFVPTYVDLARGPWTDPHESHGPFVLAIACGIAFARRRDFLTLSGAAPIAGIASILVGLILYTFGRSQEFLVFETMAQLPIAAGAILVLKGWQGLRVMAYPIAFLVFTIVWPNWLIDGLTLPLKQAATNFTVGTLFHWGYPIGSTGVVIMVGRYQLLVADACSGLTTFFSLLSIGVLYLYLARRRSLIWNAALLAAMPFIAFGANVLRIFALTLITYHFGDGVGQSFVHEFTGIFLFGIALVGVFLLDMAIERGVHLAQTYKPSSGVKP